MKICMFVRNDMTKDSRVRKEAQALIRLGHRVIVFAILGKDLPEAEESDGFQIRRIVPTYLNWLKKVWALQVRIQQLFFGSQKRPARVAAAPAATLAGQSEEVHRNWLFRPTLWLLDPHFCHQTLAEAIAERADVYHAHDLTTLRLAHQAAKKTGARLVYDSHELYLERNPVYTDFNPISNLRLRLRESRLIRKADAVITVNESIALELAKRYSIPKPHVIMNIPPRQFNLDPSLLRKRLRDELDVVVRPEQKILLYIGGLSRGHGLEQVIASLRSLPDAIFVMMGYGYHGNFLENLMRGVEAGDLAERVFVLAPVPSADVSRYASGADVGLIPIQNTCKSYFYCSPNKIFECIAAHVPVAASNFPELRRIIESFQIGEFFDERDPQDIARAVRKILDAPKRYAELKHNTKRAAEALTWEREAGKLQKIYESLDEDARKGRITGKGALTRQR